VKRFSLWVVEDDPVQRAGTQSLLAQSAWADRLDVAAFSGFDEVKAKLLASDVPDILLCDIDLGEGFLSGVDMVNVLFTRKRTKVIYTTAYLNLVGSVYNSDHVCTIGKPFSLRQLELALDRAEQAIVRDAAEYLAYSVGASVRKLPCSQIVWLESSGHHVKINTLNDVRETYDSLRDLAGRLPSTFARSHKSYVVNLAHAVELDGDGLMMVNGFRVPVSRSYRTALKSELMSFLEMIG
jgi:DNA-binding LytR/AlgR family response regulator